MRYVITLVFIISCCIIAASIAANQVLQNKPKYSLTPGFKNPEVKQSNIDTTICVNGYSSSIRPPLGYTSFLKREELRYYKLPGQVSDYELDHFIPLSLGGSPYDTRNLWLESDAGANQSDPLELQLWHKVCARAVTLKAAQAQIVSFKRANG